MTRQLHLITTAVLATVLASLVYRYWGPELAFYVIGGNFMGFLCSEFQQSYED
jgi:hypothetical protein